MTELPGLNAGSLDAYLRALGTMRLADRTCEGLRWSWTARETLRVHGVEDVETLARRIADAMREDPALVAPIQTPWRGKRGKDVAFRDLRAEADEPLLDWFDACAVARLAPDETGSRHNPLLGQGGGFGRAEMADAFAAAMKRIGPDAKRPDRVARALSASLSGSALEPADARSVQLSKKALGAYQSGRGTGPGASVLDEAPTNQKASSSAWDVVLMLEGLRSFRGAATRRAGLGQASFPLLVRADAVGLEGANRHQDRADDYYQDRADANYEVLAPLWSAPARARTIVSMIGRTRIRLVAGSRARVAVDALEALVAQAGVTVGALGFDRCVRFALYAPSDPRYRYAVRRGLVRAHGSTAASMAAETLVPFLRAEARLEPRGEHRAASHRRAERELREAVAALAGDEDQGTPTRLVLSRLVELELMAARAHKPDDLARLVLAAVGRRWDRSGGEGPDRPWRIARALAWTAVAPGDGSDSWLRPVLLPQRRGPEGWRLSAEVAVPDLARGSAPAEQLLELVRRHAVRPGSGAPLRVSGSYGTVSLRDVEWLLAHEGPSLDEIAQLTAVAARIWWPRPSSGRDAPITRTTGVGTAADGRSPTPRREALARVLLAAQPTDEDERSARRIGEAQTTPHPALARRARLAGLAAAGHVDALTREATAELWRRRSRAPLTSGRALLSVDRNRLALATLLPLRSTAVETLAAQFPKEETP